MTGAYFRVHRGGQWESVELEHLTNDERKNLLKDRDNDFVLSCLELTCKKIRENEQVMNQLVDEGILSTA